MARFFRWSLTFLLLLATAMECLQVLLRHFFQMPVIWVHESVILAAIWIYMLGCANASREDTQIAVRILPVFFHGPKMPAICDFLSRLASVVISFWLTWHSIKYFLYSIQANRKTASLDLPLYIGEAAIAAGMVLASWYCLVQLAASLLRLRQTKRISSC